MITKKTIGAAILMLVIGSLFSGTVAVHGASVAVSSWIISIATTALIAVGVWLMLD